MTVPVIARLIVRSLLSDDTYGATRRPIIRTRRHRAVDGAA